MRIFKNVAIEGLNKKPILTDIGYLENNKPKPIIIFLHGFKGFKDWGHFNFIMNFFIQQEFVFIKFNFSFNGGTIDQPLDFPDLEAFGNNDYIKELNDVESVLNWINTNTLLPASEVNTQHIFLIGHSRGGGIAIIKASEDTRIKKLVTWAAVSDFISRVSDIEEWKKNGVVYVENARTKQKMPMYFNFVETLLGNQERLNIEKCEKKLKIPHLIIHGTHDEAVHFSEAENLKKWNPSANLFLIQKANHTFGISHPHLDNEISFQAKSVLEKTLNFLKGN
ncbi:MAG: prolyl oligopeptidase family serine peptidase [Bacteroidetes bacterium]|nr:alpha/beta hydrolase [Bacteroidota bacterium]MBV6462341.1 hypothetical protein [Flavobacteriales bacterium]WKZ74335.1 MAG: alpha/beta hydrolase fold domain-containing protein [Vicingaceae bacterium]MCL4816003.1 prolyl oligopeptidase family serine peptidase [Flavobacteriales bacterium]NOG96168.1 prolyl oligopeptidase family serine peptidase [Bacteroidota bacterium]